MDTTEKKWWQSKTLWVNALMFILAIAQTDLILSFNLSPEVIAGVITAVNFILRFLTSQPIASGK